MGESKRRKQTDPTYGTSNSTVAKALCTGAQQFTSEVSEVLSGIETVDQANWRNNIELFFTRVGDILRATGTGVTVPDEPDWIRAQLWADYFLSLFLAIDRGWKHIEPSLKGKMSYTPTPSQMLTEIARGWAFHLNEKSLQSDYRNSAKLMAEDLRKIKKMLTGPVNRQAKNTEVAMQAVETRIEDPTYFAAHNLCMRILTGVKDQRVKDALNSLDMAAERLLAAELRLVSESKGFGFIEGRQVTSTGKAGAWKHIADTETS
jgi:hypothetical protein